MFFSFFDCQNQLKNMKWPKGRASARAFIYIEMNCEYMSTICASLPNSRWEPLLKRVNDMLLIVWSSYSLYSLHVCCFKFRAGHCDKEPTIVWARWIGARQQQQSSFYCPIPGSRILMRYRTIHQLHYCMTEALSSVYPKTCICVWWIYSQIEKPKVLFYSCVCLY